MAEALLGLGSNLGDTRANLARALQRLSSRCRIVRVSSLYRTEPVGYADQDWFLNAAAALETDLAPEALLAFCASIEHELGRERKIVNGPRTIDIDVLAMGAIVRTQAPILPHPRLHLRRFVLAPLAEIAPGWRHPTARKTAVELLSELETGEAVERVSPLNWPPSGAP